MEKVSGLLYNTVLIEDAAAHVTLTIGRKQCIHGSHHWRTHCKVFICVYSMPVRSLCEPQHLILLVKTLLMC